MNPYAFLLIQLFATGVLTGWAIQLYRWQKTLQIWHGALTRLQKLLSTQQAMQMFNAGQSPTLPPEENHTTIH